MLKNQLARLIISAYLCLRSLHDGPEIERTPGPCVKWAHYTSEVDRAQALIRCSRGKTVGSTDQRPNMGDDRLPFHRRSSQI